MQGDSREPAGFAAVLPGLMADRAWDLPAVGGTVLDRWPDIAAATAPQLPDHVAAVAFHISPKACFRDRLLSPVNATRAQRQSPRARPAQVSRPGGRDHPRGRGGTP